MGKERVNAVIMQSSLPEKSVVVLALKHRLPGLGRSSRVGRSTPAVPSRSRERPLTAQMGRSDRGARTAVVARTPDEAVKKRVIRRGRRGFLGADGGGVGRPTGS